MKAPAYAPAVKEKFESYPKALKKKLERLRQIILATAAKSEDIGALEETLKWGQPSYLTNESKSGTTIRIDQVKSNPNQYALYVHCQTSLIASYRELYGDTFQYEGTRGMLFDVKDKLNEEAIGHCIELALTYHLRKRKDQLPF